MSTVLYFSMAAFWLGKIRLEVLSLCEVIVDLYLNILGVYFKMSRSFMAGLDSFDGIMTSCFVLQNFTFLKHFRYPSFNA